MGAKACILCGREGPLTREHIWPQWYSEMLSGKVFRQETIKGDEIAISRQTDSLDLQPRVLCVPCNTDWGSNLETRVRMAGLERMIFGDEEIVSLPTARAIAAWATLKCAAGEYLSRSQRGVMPFFSQDQLSYLRKKTRPPAQTFLWIGRYVGTRYPAGWIFDVRSWKPHPDDETVGTDLYAVTYSIGQVAIQLVGVDLFPVELGKEDRTMDLFLPVSPGRWNEALIPIWPLPDKPFRWPPTKAFDDKGFHALARRWHEQEQKAPRKARYKPTPKRH